MAGIISTDNLKDYLEVSGTGRDDAFTLIVAGVNAHLAKETGRDWQSIVRNERYAGTGSRALMLKHLPVTAVTSISEDGTAIDPADTEEVEIDKVKGILWRVSGVWMRSIEWFYEILYTGGEVPPGDLTLAGLELGSWIWRTRGGRQAIRGIDMTVAIAKARSELPMVSEIIGANSDSARGYIRCQELAAP